MNDLKTIKISKLKPSSTNYRQSTNKKAMEELTGSVKSKGIIQPILVRPANGDGTFEIVCGNRRYQAAVNAELKDMPVIVRDLTDEEALECQVIENNHREDPNPMEEADGFKRLLDIGKHTTETLAAKLDRSTSYVTGRLKLLKLPKQAQDKILSGDISIGHALLITRLKNAGDQKEYLKMITENDISVREAKQRIRQFSNKINEAPFDIEKCNTCPYLSDNQTDLFPDLKKTGECMDRSCFFTKSKAHFKSIIDERKKQGFQIFTNKEKVAGQKIVAPGTKDCHYNDIKPKRYKSECMKCFKFHAFFMSIDQDRWSDRKIIYFGEICLDKKCLDRMNGLNQRNSGNGADDNGSSSGMSNYNLELKARDCRDRFLRQTLPAAVQSSQTLFTRMLIYHLIDKFRDFKGRHDILIKHCSKSNYASISNNYDCQNYKPVQDIPDDQLPAVLKDILIASIDVADPELLLRMTEEAGIDMSRDFAVDKQFLNSKTKAELIKFVEKFKLDIEVSDKIKKPDIVKAILTQDLKGKLPEECTAVCEIEDDDDDFDGDFDNETE